MFNLLATTAYAAGEQAQQPSILDMMLLPAAFLVIMYFLIIRPQQRKTKDHQKLLETLKSGDEVVTSGGIIGRVKSVADGFVTLEVGSNTFLKVIKAHIAGLTKDPSKDAVKS